MKNDKAMSDILIVLAIVGIIGIVCVFAVIMFFAGGAAKVAANELEPSVLQQKYEWFKDASAQLDAKIANIEVYQGRINRLQNTYNGTPRNQWNRADIDQINLYESEVGGIKARN